MIAGGGARGGRGASERFTSEPSVTFTDTTDGWLYSAAVDGAKLLHTRGGGATWYEQRLPFPPGPANQWTVRFVDARVAVISATVCATGYGDCSEHVYVSTDGGDTWEERGTFLDAGSCGRNEVAATDAAHVRAVTTRCEQVSVQTVRITDDGGRTWRSFDLPATQHFVRMQFFSPLVGRAIQFTCGTESCSMEFGRMSDGGATWSTEPMPSEMAHTYSASSGSDSCRRSTCS